MNTYKIGDAVKTVSGSRTGGIVKYIACHYATQAGGRVCDKKVCSHNIKNHCWVKWADSTVCSYEYTELALDHSSTQVNDVKPEAKPDSVYVNEAKLTIDKVIATERGMTREEGQLYDGFAQIRTTRNGQHILHYINGSPELHKDKKPIEGDELDYDAYNSFGETKIKTKE